MATRFSYTPITRPASLSAARHWQQLVDYVAATLMRSPDATSPLVLGNTARLLAAAALSTFPNTAVLTSTIANHHDAHPAALRRAIAYIETNPDLDVGLLDIARVARVSPRAVQLAFRHHLDTTPMAYLRRIRPDRAHADLLAAGPDDGATVTAVAARRGFRSSSRFTAHYHAAYGQPPSRILHADRPESLSCPA